MILPVYQVSVKKKNTTSEMITTLLVREGFTKKSSRSFGFCSNYLDPPTPQFGQLVPLFLNANVAKNLGRGLPPPPPLPIPKLTQYTVCEKWTTNFGRAPLPLIWTKSKRTTTFFRETFSKSLGDSRKKAGKSSRPCFFGNDQCLA